MDTVFIEALSVDTVIGVYDWEKKIQQTLLFDIEMDTCIGKAASTDDLQHTLDYEAISNRIIAHTQNARVELLETLVEQIAQIILNEFSVSRVVITLHKPGAVKAAKSVGIRIVRTSEQG
ncbi:dihydroneopterin aldolase [Echinimonas agarilytica]|uniref:7,8-dihydroneopterin aldolase n=1 Tax=Echinimonas agarilytica TaxID=1215918 RepID=A0AA41W742_9GAMM|nr:dihydroneopterin aldolase [Echinimonas agarilytica]MCM2680370.1 dihydroneopterin aldolase [Echinimonas agarilytica]